MFSQQSFNPADHKFTWTSDGWYTWDADAAKKAARQARTAAANVAKAQGYKVRLWTLSNQRITRGGIGSGHPEITMFCSVYMMNVD